MSRIRHSVAGRFIAILLAMQLLGAAFCLPSMSEVAPSDAVAIETVDHDGDACGSAQNDCHKTLCHPELAASSGAIAIEPESQRHLTFQRSFAQFASGPDSRPPLSASA